MRELATVGDTCLKYMYRGLAVNVVRTSQLNAKHGHVRNSSTTLPN